jgi:transcriptional regulator of arginine metabolism
LQDQGETPDLIVTENAIDAAIIEYAVFVKRVQFMTIIRTTDSRGNAVAGIIDDANLPQVIATLAGFDTIYVTSPDEVSAEALTKRWSALIG